MKQAKIQLGHWCMAGICILGLVSPLWAEDGFTPSDRERLARVEATLTVFMQQIDKRFEQIDKRFEQVDKRFEQMERRFDQMVQMFYTLAAIFTSLFVAVFGFAWWDRRSVISTAKKAAREEVTERTQGLEQTMLKVDRILEVLRGFSENMPDLKEMMRRANLL
jgi:chaperonin cofactor prefoldin